MRLFALVLVAACAHRTDALEGRIEALEAENDALEARVAELEAASAERTDREAAIAERRARLESARAEIEERGPRRLPEGVEKLDELHYRIDRSALDAFQAATTDRMNGVRAIPHRDVDGDIDGFRLSALPRDTDLLGLVNGDVVNALAGQALRSVEDTLAAYEAAMSSDRIEVGITRRGQPITLVWEVGP